MNTLFNTNDERKRKICDKIIHKAMIIPVDIHQTNKKFSVTVQPKNACKLEFTYHLWLPFIHQPQSNIVVFAIITFHIYHVLVTKLKHGIFPKDRITINKELEILTTSVKELTNIDESSHENAIVISITENT